ncbi:MAG: hypothetical protein AB7G93_06675 [Bdellovibrionales bacterium]
MTKRLVCVSLFLIAAAWTAGADQIFRMGTAEGEILRYAQRCSYQVSFDGMVDSPRYGELDYHSSVDAFVGTMSGLTMTVYRSAQAVHMGEPAAEKQSLKTYIIEGATSRGVRMDYKGYDSATVFCWYMK